MRTGHLSLIVAILGGIAMLVACQVFEFFLAERTSTLGFVHPPQYPWWSASAQAVISSVQSVGPGLLAGWLARRSGLAVGVAVGFVGQFAVWGVESFYLGIDPFIGLEVFRIFVLLVTSSFTNGVGGVAGVAIRVRGAPSNESAQGGRPSAAPGLQR